MKKIFVVIFLLVAFAACKSHDHSSCDGHDGAEVSYNHDEHTDEHDHEAEAHDHDGESKSETESHDHDGAIVLSPEEAMVLGVEAKVVEPSSFNNIIHTSGKIMSAQGDENSVAATASGKVFFPAKSLAEGTVVSKGEVLFTIVSEDMADDNYSQQFNDAKAALTKAESDLKRAEELVEDKIISEKDFSAVKLSYDQAKNQYEKLSKNYTSKGKSIVSPISGYIKNISVKEGDYVSSGEKLAVVSQNRRLVLRADVPQKEYANLQNISTATFKTPYDNKVYDISSLNGRLLSSGKSSDDNSFYIPVTFEFDNKGEVIPGSFVEVYLKSLPVNDVIVVPLSSLIEEQGTYSLFVKNCPESYEKRAVTLGQNDGKDVVVKSGLKGGENVVVSGPYYLKLASMSNAVPDAHNH